MTDSTSNLAAIRQRLDRLDGLLREDPSNPALLVDAFETALACGEWERARFHLTHGQSSGVEPLAWRLREGDFWLAQQRYDQAQGVLAPLINAPQPPAGFAEVLMHNLAFIALRRGDSAGCIARLAPILEGSASDKGVAAALAPTATRALQQLWLRALHHEGELERAMAWTLGAERLNRLDPQAAGVAALIAIDASDFAAAQRWSAASLANSPPGQGLPEASVAHASLALAARDAARALQFTDAALQRHPDDGRAWSTRAFALLLARDLPAAHEAFDRALAVMGQHIGTWHGLAWTQLLEGELPAARGSFEAALALDRNFAESHGGLAVVLAMQQLREDAQMHAEAALRLDRRCVSAGYAQALLSGEIKDGEDLQRLARRLLEGRGPL